MWQDRVPQKFRDAAPRIERLRGTVDLGMGDLRFIERDEAPLADVWHYDGRRIPLVRIAAASGYDRSEIDGRAVTYDDMHKACYDPAARLAAMDQAGIEASVCFPNMFERFCGQTFSFAQDKELALLCIRAYNDYVIEEWCAGSHGRLVPMGIVPLWDVDLAVAETERLAGLGFRSITFSEAPHLLGLPSIHSHHWDPLFAACQDAQIVVSLHIGTGGFPMLAKDGPGSIPNVMASFNAGYALADWLLSGLLAKFADLKIVLAESQLAWVPYVLSRADFVWNEMRGANFTDIDTSQMPEPPSFYFHRNVFLTFFRDPVGLTLLDQLGADNVLYETDFPHSDSSWPTSRSVATEMTADLAEADARKIVADNARALFRVQTTS
ncbi:amidohydrolase family protein [Ilumatobacter sp.]|uniref:amidohydrolase family protein n=1 Tax=Ilumatobacter sp. TaxID=1967498 RepID=UPI003C3ACDF9